MAHFLALAFLLMAGQAQAAFIVAPTTVSVQNVDGGILDVAGVVTTTASISAIQLDITVAAGTGEEVFTATGTIKLCSILAVSDAAVYTFIIVTDGADEYPILGKKGLYGDVGLAANRVVLGVHVVRITNATIDGTYKVRCVLLE